MKAILKTYRQKKIIYPRDVENAKRIIQTEFENHSINSEVRFFAELVEEIKDESWRKAAETFLGRKRYFLIVDDEYCDVALRILKENKLTNANVVLSDKIPDSDIEKDSAAEILEIKNKAARKYANYLLNGIHLCDSLEDLHEHPKGGLMKDGMLAKSYAASMMKIDEVIPCLGKNAVDMQLKMKEREKEGTLKALQGISDQINTIRDLLRILGSIEWKPENYDFESVENIKLLKDKLGKIAEEIDILKKSPDMLRAMQEIEMAQNKVTELTEKSDNISEGLGENRGVKIANEKRIVSLNQSIVS